MKTVGELIQHEQTERALRNLKLQRERKHARLVAAGWPPVLADVVMAGAAPDTRRFQLTLRSGTRITMCGVYISESGFSEAWLSARSPVGKLPDITVDRSSSGEPCEEYATDIRVAEIESVVVMGAEHEGAEEQP